MARKCYRCGSADHLKRDCPRNRLHVVAAPDSSIVNPELELAQVRPPDMAAAHAYWDTTAPLVPIEEAWWGRKPESTAASARDVRLRTEAARQVEESRAARGVL